MIREGLNDKEIYSIPATPWTAAGKVIRATSVFNMPNAPPVPDAGPKQQMTATYMGRLVAAGTLVAVSNVNPATNVMVKMLFGA